MHTIETRLWPNFAWILVNRDSVKMSIFPVPRLWCSIDSVSRQDIVRSMKGFGLNAHVIPDMQWLERDVRVATLLTPPTNVVDNRATTVGMLLRMYNIFCQYTPQIREITCSGYLIN